ncbi:MAG: hypothetical protein QOK10_89 [Pseudonocardiales bacterium]|jgi:hypothetical protein|nr:hypothetical protein [Pseudonocardiales bacterium]
MYSQPIDRHHPGCILFLVDQSASMQDRFAGGLQSKATALSLAVNRLIRNLVLQCQRGEEVRDYYHLGLVGYGKSVGPVFGGDLAGQQLVPISVIADYPLRMATDSLPGNPEVSVDLPVWIDPVADGGTPMTAAVNLAGSIIVEWANSHLDSFPPIVVNISDGEATDGDPRSIAAQLREIRTTDGTLLLFNVNLSDQALTPIEYPNSPVGLPNPYAIGLFEMSSELTPYMMAVARGMDLPVESGARGFVFNADAAKLSEFLDVGTRVSQVADR